MHKHILLEHLTLSRSILHDESVYPDPFEFRPERYLDKEGKLRQLGKAEDPAMAAFGFGRRFVSSKILTYSGAVLEADSRLILFHRICPGLFLADNSIFLAIATMLYVFHISKANDQHSAEITPAIEYDGFIRYLCTPQLTC